MQWWGALLPIDASHCLSRMAWMRRNHPDVWARTRWVMAPKDFCVLRLTGEAAADPIASVGLVDRHLGYLGPLLDLVPGAAERLAPLQKFTHRVGKSPQAFPARERRSWSAPWMPGAACSGSASINPAVPCISAAPARFLGLSRPAGFLRRASSPFRPMTASRCMPVRPSRAAHR